MDERRRYSDQERADALTALAANAGNVQLTATMLGIPESTLYFWATGRRHPEALRMQAEKRAPLADRLEDLAHLLLDDLARPGRRKKSSLKETATAMGIALDKMRLLRGQATTITGELAGLSDADLDREIADLQGGTPPPPAGEAPEGGGPPPP